MQQPEYFRLDKRKVRRSFERAAATYDEAAVLQRRVADELLERLSLVRIDPQRVLDLGCGSGYALAALERRYRGAQVVGLDLVPAMLRRAGRGRRWFRRRALVAGDAESLPLADDCVDVVFSNLTLQWCDPFAALAEASRVLRPRGVLVFSTFGPDTLKELRQAWAAADDEVRPHVHDFVDMHDLGDALLHTGFDLPVVDAQRINVTFARLEDLLRDLTWLGARNAAVGRGRGLTGRGRFQRLAAQYEKLRDSEGRLPSTWEVVYGHAFAPAAGKAGLTGRGVATVSVDSLRRDVCE